MWSANARDRDDDGDDDSEEDSSEEEDSDDEDAGPGAKAGPSREARKAEKKARKEAAVAKARGRNVTVGDLPSSDEDSSDEDEDEDDADMPANPNHSKAARKQATAPVIVEEEDGVEGITDGVKKMKAPASRREREAQEAQAAKERYMKLHTAGKTDEAKADLARLRLIREQREADAARKQVS
jgi:hypothetical protein